MTMHLLTRAAAIRAITDYLQSFEGYPEYTYDDMEDFLEAITLDIMETRDEAWIFYLIDSFLEYNINTNTSAIHPLVRLYIELD